MPRVGCGGFVGPMVPVAVTWALTDATAETRRTNAADSMIVECGIELFVNPKREKENRKERTRGGHRR